MASQLHSIKRSVAARSFSGPSSSLWLRSSSTLACFIADRCLTSAPSNSLPTNPRIQRMTSYVGDRRRRNVVGREVYGSGLHNSVSLLIRPSYETSRQNDNVLSDYPLSARAYSSKSFIDGLDGFEVSENSGGRKSLAPRAEIRKAAAVQRGNFLGALETVIDILMRNPEISSVPTSTLKRLFAGRRRQELDQAEKIIERASPQLNPQIAGALFDHLCLCYLDLNFHDSCKALMRKAQAQGQTPGDAVYRGLLKKELEDMPTLVQPWILLQVLKNAGFSMTTSVVSTVCQKYSAKGRIRDAVDFCRMALDTDEGSNIDKEVVLAKAMSLAARCLGLAPLKELLKVEAPYVKRDELKEILWTLLAAERAKVGHFHKCAQLVTRFKLSSKAELRPKHLLTLTEPLTLAKAVVLYLTADGRLDQAFTLLKSLNFESNDDRIPFLKLARAFGERNQLKEMENVLAWMNNWAETPLSVQGAHSVRVLTYVAAGDPDSARYYLQQMCYEHEHRAMPIPDYSVTGPLIKSYLASDRVQDALKVFDKLIDIGCQLDYSIYNALLKKLVQHDDAKSRGACKNIAREMLLDSYILDVPSTMPFSTALDAYCAIGELDRAANLIRTATSRKIMIHKRSLQTYLFLVWTNKRSFVNSAKELMQFQLNQDDRLEKVFGSFLRQIFLTRTSGNTMEVIRRLPSLGIAPGSPEHDRILVYGLCAPEKQKMFPELLRTLEENLCIGRLSHHIYNSFWSCIEVPDTQEGAEAEAANLANELMQHMILREPKMLLSFFMYRKLMSLRFKAGQLDDVLRLFDEREHIVIDGGNSFFTFSTAANACLATLNVTKLMDILEEMRNLGVFPTEEEADEWIQSVTAVIKEKDLQDNERAKALLAEQAINLFVDKAKASSLQGSHIALTP